MSVCVCAVCGRGCVRMGVCCISIIIDTHIINIKGLYECGFVLSLIVALYYVSRLELVWIYAIQIYQATKPHLTVKR